MKAKVFSRMTAAMAFGAVYLFLLVVPIISMQVIDPFYTRLLKNGKRAYLEGDYAGALENLEIAAFGLFPDKILQAEAYTLMALCRYHLREFQESRELLTKALGLMEEEELSELVLPEKARSELSGLLVRFELAGYEKPKPQVRIVRKRDDLSPPVIGPGKDAGELAADLERRIKADPSLVVNYYDLVAIYKKEGEKKKVRRTLERLVKVHPEEVYGYYLLGGLHYREGEYKKAEEYFTEALKPRRNVVLSEDLLQEVRAYQILSAYQQGDKERARRMMAASSHVFTLARIQTLPLGEEAKILLLSLR